MDRHITPKPNKNASGFKDWKQRRRIWNSKRRGIEKIALLYLLDQANEEHFNATGELKAWPNRQSLAARTGFSERAIYDAVKSLKQDGIVSTKEVTGARGRFASKEYYLYLDALIEDLATRDESDSPSASAADGEQATPSAAPAATIGIPRRHRRRLTPPPSASAADKQEIEPAKETSDINTRVHASVHEPDHQSLVKVEPSLSEASSPGEVEQLMPPSACAAYGEPSEFCVNGCGRYARMLWSGWCSECAEAPKPPQEEPALVEPQRIAQIEVACTEPRCTNTWLVWPQNIDVEQYCPQLHRAQHKEAQRQTRIAEFRRRHIAAV